MKTIRGLMSSSIRDMSGTWTFCSQQREQRPKGANLGTWPDSDSRPPVKHKTAKYAKHANCNSTFFLENGGSAPQTYSASAANQDEVVRCVLQFDLHFLISEWGIQATVSITITSWYHVTPRTRRVSSLLWTLIFFSIVALNIASVSEGLSTGRRWG